MKQTKFLPQWSETKYIRKTCTVLDVRKYYRQK